MYINCHCLLSVLFLAAFYEKTTLYIYIYIFTGFYLQIFFVYLCHIFAMLSVCILQFFNLMIVTGFLLSFVMAAVLIMWIQVAVDIFLLI